MGEKRKMVDIYSHKKRWKQGDTYSDISEAPSFYNYDYIHETFQTQFLNFPESESHVLKKVDTVRTINFLLNEYTRSRLMYYDLLNSIFFKTKTIQEIIETEKHHNHFIGFRNHQERENFLKKIEDDFKKKYSPITAQSSLFLIQQVIINNFRRERYIEEDMKAVNKLFFQFIEKTDPKSEKNKNLYYDQIDLQIIKNYFCKIPTDICHILPILYEDDDIYSDFCGWSENISKTHIHPDERSDSISLINLKKLELELVQNFLKTSKFPIALNPETMERNFSTLINQIIGKDLLTEIISFYEMYFPHKVSCGIEQKQSEFIHGLNLFKIILQKYYGNNFISVGYLEFWNLFKKYKIPDEIIDSFILDTKITPMHSNAYDILWRRPFIRLRKPGKKPFDKIFFSYIQIFDAFFYFISSTIKSLPLGEVRGRKFEELTANWINDNIDFSTKIKDSAQPFKIVIYDEENAKTDPNQRYQKMLSQINLQDSLGNPIPCHKVMIDSKNLNLGLFNFREIDLAFVYKGILFIIECKNNLLSILSDFEPIVFRRCISTLRNMKNKYDLCSSDWFKKALSKYTRISFDKVISIMISAEDCPFTYMLSFHDFASFLKNIDEIVENIDSDTYYIDKNMIPYKEDEEENHLNEILEEKLEQEEKNENGQQQKEQENKEKLIINDEINY